MELRYLYVQELVASGMVRIRKVRGTLNPADILTKHIAKDTLHRHLPTFGVCGLATHRGLDFATHHLSQKNPDEKEETLRVERITFCGHVLLLACADMSLFMYTCHVTCACAVRHVSTFARLRNFSLSPEQELLNFPLLVFRVPVFPNRNEETLP